MCVPKALSVLDPADSPPVETLLPHQSCPSIPHSGHAPSVPPTGHTPSAQGRGLLLAWLAPAGCLWPWQQP